MIVIPREICRDLPRALAREWIVTNGIGGYASSTITGANTRRYHGLLIAALAPPAARVVLLSKIDEEVQIGGLTYRLGTNQYENGTIHPDGYLYLERVELDGMLPTFFYQAPNFALTKTIWMEHGANTTHIHYQLARESAPIQLTLLPLCTHKNFHSELRGAAEWRFAVAAHGGELEINAFEGATPYRLLFPPRVQFVPLDLWYWRFLHAREQDRGYDAVEDLFLPGLLRVNLRGGETLTITATTDARGIGNSVARSRARARTRQKLLARRAQDDVEKQLRVAADQFIIHRADEKENRARVLAGYPWFDERTRATLIALEGLLIVTRRYTEAKEILRAYAAEIENGLIPNRIRADGARDFDAADVTLWFFHALDRYHAATRDDALARELFPQLESVIEWHVNGTRNNIHVDPRDGLLFAGEAGTALTWMDARVGDAAITPRIGKPVEINALWYRALRVMERWAKRLKRAPEKYAQMADRAQIAFERFWFAEGGYLYDVIDAPNGDAAALRPNQLFALSLANDLVTRARGESILQIVTTELLTPLGLRTLAPRDPNYRAQYHGSADERDAASHQGAVWAWLIGAYVDAYQNVYGEKPARDLFAPFYAAMQAYALGTLGEIFEPAPPFASVGGIAYAASVAEVLRIRARY